MRISTVKVYNNFILFIVEESLDVDPNYDPSDFLMAGLPMCKPELVKEDITIDEHHVGIHDDLAVSESEDEGTDTHLTEMQQQMQDEDDGGDLWF